MHVSDPSEARPRPCRLPRLTACAALALLAPGVYAAQASAASVTVPAACVVVDPAAVKGSPMVVSGTGFAPGDTIELTTDKGAGFGNTTADASGNISTTMAAPELSKSTPGKATFVLTAADQTDGVTTAQTSFVAANLAADANPAKAKLGKKVTFTFSGFTGGAEIYGHYLHRNKLVISEKMGRSSGPCGLLKTRAALFPKRARYQSYKIQYDDSRRYSKTSIPRLIATLSTVSF
jgi:hypothetical protein